MSQCPQCHHTVIQTTYAGVPLTLDPVPWTYATVDEHALVPEEGSRVFRSLALVDHTYTCPARQRERDAQRRSSASQKQTSSAAQKQTRGRPSRAPY